MIADNKNLSNIKSSATRFIHDKSAQLFVGLLIFLAPKPAMADDECVEIAISLGDSGTCVGGDGENPIFAYIAAIVQWLAVGVGLVVTLMIVISGVQYITSSGNPQGLEAAKKKLLHAIEALILFIFMAAIANFIIPGGII